MSVRIVFLGGLGEIGRNCFCLEVDGRILVVDCGIMFPDADMPGVDLVLPDFTYLRENADRVEGVFLTHAHEDHAGGLAYLLRDVPTPIYGSPLSLGLARNRIEEAGMLGNTEHFPSPEELSAAEIGDALEELKERFKNDAESFEYHKHLLAKDFLGYQPIAIKLNGMISEIITA